MGTVQNVKDNNQINASKQESISSNPVAFKNSKTLPESLQRLEDIPLNVIKSLVSSYLLVITSILDKMLETLGLEMGDPEALEENLEKATERIKFMTWVMIQVLKDEEVRENIRQLAIALNDSALKPFLKAALLTLDEMQPAIDVASDKLAEKVHSGVRKLIDAGGNAVLSGLGTVPYVGNVLNATDTIANTLMGVQAIADTAVALILETTFRVLLILKKVKGPGLDAVDSFVDFGLQSYNTYLKVVGAVDKINAMAKGQKFDPTANLMSKEDFLKEVQKEGAKTGTIPNIPDPTKAIPDPTKAIPDPTKAIPDPTKAIPNPIKQPLPIQKGGGRKFKTSWFGRFTRKRNQKKGTRFTKRPKINYNYI